MIGAGGRALVGAALAGRLAERFGTRRVVRATALTYGAPMIVPFLFDDTALLVPMIPLIAASAGVMMALPYAMLIPMMPRADHGLLTGIYSMSRGRDRARPAARGRGDRGPAGARHAARDRRVLGSLAGRRPLAARERATARDVPSGADARTPRGTGGQGVDPIVTRSTPAVAGHPLRTLCEAEVAEQPDGGGHPARSPAPRRPGPRPSGPCKRPVCVGVATRGTRGDHGVGLNRRASVTRDGAEG